MKKIIVLVMVALLLPVVFSSFKPEVQETSQEVTIQQSSKELTGWQLKVAEQNKQRAERQKAYIER